MRVVELDDFDRLEEPGRLLREMHGQHRADREVRRDEHRDIGPGGQPAADLPHPFVVEPGGADDGVNAVLDEELQVVHHHIGMGEVDDDLGVAVCQQTERLVGVYLGRQGQVVGLLNRRNHGRADLALAAQHRDPHGHTLVR